MGRSRYVLTALCVLVLSLLLNKPATVVGQSAAVTYQNPLFYIGEDGNIYVTSLDATGATPLTSDATERTYRSAIPVGQGAIGYRVIEWPVNGPNFCAARWAINEEFTSDYILLESGKSARYSTSGEQALTPNFSLAFGCDWDPQFAMRKPDLPVRCVIDAYPNDSDLAIEDE